MPIPTERLPFPITQLTAADHFPCLPVSPYLPVCHYYHYRLLQFFEKNWKVLIFNATVFLCLTCLVGYMAFFCCCCWFFCCCCCWWTVVCHVSKYKKGQISLKAHGDRTFVKQILFYLCLCNSWIMPCCQLWLFLIQSLRTQGAKAEGIVKFLDCCKIIVEWKFDFICLSLLSRDRVCLVFFTKKQW